MSKPRHPEQIKFEPALPCATPTAGGGYCGQPATVGLVSQAPPDPGRPGGPYFVVQPICKDCVRRWVKVYE